MDIGINHLDFNSSHHDKYIVALKCGPLVTTYNLFSLEVVQKYQYCQLGILWENSNNRKHKIRYN